MINKQKTTVQRVLLDYFDKFEAIERYGKDKYISLEYLNKEVMFGITTLPDARGGIIYKDVLGNVIKGHTFMFSAFFNYSEDLLSMIDNSSFFEELLYWVEHNNIDKVLPDFGEEDGRLALEVELIQTPYLYVVDDDNKSAQYAVTFRLKYKEKRY